MAKTTKKTKQTDLLRDAVDSYIQQQSNATFNYKQVSHALGVENPAQQRVVALKLAELAFDGDLIEVSPG